MTSAFVFLRRITARESACAIFLPAFSFSLLLLVIASGITSGADIYVSQKPNVIVIMADDLGYATLVFKVILLELKVYSRLNMYVYVWARVYNYVG